MADKKYIIGIPGTKVGDDFFGVPLTYMVYASFFGIPRVIGMEEEVIEDLDLLILPGGPDVNPLRYGQTPHWYTNRPDPMKEFFDVYRLPGYIETGVPIYGICRGIQTIAVHFGAKLLQNINHPFSKDDRSDLVHTLDFPDTTFREEFSEHHSIKGRKVNSLHHQCVSGEGLPDCLEILATYNKDKRGFIEVLRHKNLPIYGVQYHPEELGEDALGDFIIQHKLLPKSKNYRQDA